MFRIERNVDYLLVGGVVKARLGAAVDTLTVNHLSYYYYIPVAGNLKDRRNRKL